MKHTTGPWHYLQGHNGEFIITCESGGFAPIARVKGDKRTTLKDAKANARLIAVAPDLVASVDAFLDIMDMMLADGIELSDDEAAARAQGLAVIARVRGEP